MTDNLEKLLNMQRSFGGKWVDFGDLSMIKKEEWTKEFVVACIDELMETLKETNFKHWKKPIPVNVKNVKDELIDLLHFVLSLFLVWDMDSKEIVKVYEAKHVVNYKRQKEGY